MSATFTLPFLLAFGIGYLLGSIPFGLVLTKLAGLGDVRAIGSGNIGATNVLRTGNKKLAAATLLLDLLKGTAAVFVAFLLMPKVGQAITGNQIGGLISFMRSWEAGLWIGGLGAFLGHLFPVWLGFKGGKGVATFIGVLLGAAWPAALVFCVTWLVVAAVTRYSSLSALVATFVTFLYFAFRGGPYVVPIVAVMAALLFWKHRENIRRLVAGQESRIGAKG